MGAVGIQRFFADLRDTFPDFWVDVEHVEAVGEDRALVFERGRASGRSSGVTVDDGIPFGAIYDFADGKIKRIRVFADRGDALEAAGLSE